MNTVLTFGELGLRHITDPRGLDHVLFLVALAAAYRPRDWRHGLLVVSAFTLGHSLTLALAVLQVVAFPGPVVEFLIPVTIVLAGLENFRDRTIPQGWPRPALAAGFGLIHGAGFAGYLRSLFQGDVTLPLLGFNLGLEAGQALVLIATVLGLAGLDRMVSRLGPVRLARPVTITATLTVITVATVMAAQRSPW